MGLIQEPWIQDNVVRGLPTQSCKSLYTFTLMNMNNQKLSNNNDIC